VRSELIKQHVGMFDEQFFALLAALAQSAMAADKNLCQTTGDLQKHCSKKTEIWRGLKELLGKWKQSKSPWQRRGRGCARKLLELVSVLPSDARMRAYVSMGARWHGLSILPITY